MARASEGCLFLTMRDDSNSAALPLANLCLYFLGGTAAQLQPLRRRVWIIVDELPVLGIGQVKLETLVTRGRTSTDRPPASWAFRA